MTCETVQVWISAYVDDALDQEFLPSMFAHLGTCEECQRFLRVSLRIRATIVAEPMYAAPESLDRRVRDRVEGRAGSDRMNVDVWSIRLSIPVPAAVAMAVVLIIGSMIFSPFFFERTPQMQLSEETLQHLPGALRSQMRLTQFVLGQ